MTAFGAPAIAILIFAIILIFTMVKSVPQGENWTVERFGRYTRTLIGERQARAIMEAVADLERQGLLTSDWDTNDTRPRKFYRTSDEGAKLADLLLRDWKDLTAAFHALRGES